MKVWILLANAAQALLVRTEHLATQPLELVSKLEHSASRKKTAELGTDRPGKNHLAGSFDNTDLHDVESEAFALQLVKELEKHHHQEAIHQLILTCPPHFHGLIMKHLPQWPGVSLRYFAKDLTKLTLPEIRERLLELVTES